MINKIVNEEVLTSRVELIDNYTSKMQSIIQITDRFTSTTEKVTTYTNDMTKKMTSNSKISQVAFSNIGSAAKSASLNIVGLSNSIDSVAGSFSNVIANASTFSGFMVVASTVASMSSNGFRSLGSSINSVAKALNSMGSMLNSSSNSTNGFKSKVDSLKTIMASLKPLAKAGQFMLSIHVKDSASKTFDSIKSKYKSIQGLLNKSEFVIKAKERVTKAVAYAMISLICLKNMAKVEVEVAAIKGNNFAQFIQNVMVKLQKLKSEKWLATISAKDIATGVTKVAFKGLKKVAGKVWNITLKAVDMASKIIGSIFGKLGKLKKGVTVGIKMGVQGLGEQQLRNITMSNVIHNSGSTKVQSKQKAAVYDREVQKIGASALLNRGDAGLLGTRGLMISGGKTEQAKLATRNMASVKAFTGDTRTAFEVAEAFSSAKSGDLSSLNNMLGEDYSSFEEAMKGIQEKQGGILDEYEKTIPGKFSMLKFNLSQGMIDAIKPLEGVIVGMMDKVMAMIDAIGPGLTDFSERLATVINGGELVGGNPMINQIATIIGSIPEAISNVVTMLTENIDFEAILESLQPIFDVITGVLDDINNKSGITSGLMSILGTVITTAFEMIGPVIEAVSPVITSILSFIAEHSQSINNIISALGVIWSAVWSLIGPILQGVWNIISPILGSIVDLVGKGAEKIVSFSNKWTELKDKIAKNPIVASVKTIFSKVSGILGNDKTGKNNAFGLNYVPYNDYVTRLHEGEMVLTKQEANKYRSKNGANMNIGKLADTIVIREEADIDKITSKLVQKLNENRIAYGGVF